MSPLAAHDMHELLAFMRLQWGLERTVFCSGSMGGTSNLIYAVLHPGDVQGVVARGAATDMDSYRRWCAQQTRPVLKEIGEAIESAYGGAPEDLPHVYRRHSAMQNADRLTMPVYLAHGEADSVIPVSQARALAERMAGRSNLAYHEVPNGNHDSPLTETAGFSWVLEQMG